MRERRFVMLLAAAVLFSIPAYSQPADEWEYMILILDQPYIQTPSQTTYGQIRDRYHRAPDLERDLNEFGQRGWMIASVVIDGQGRYVIFLQRKI